MYHAEQMPVLEWGDVVVKKKDGTLWEVTAEVRNTRLMPTRNAMQQRDRIGRVDLWEMSGAKVVAAAKVDGWFEVGARSAEREPGRVQMGEGVPGRAGRIIRWFVEGAEGATLSMVYSSERAKKIERTIELRETGKR